jgi:hypothetical protein
MKSYALSVLLCICLLCTGAGDLACMADDAAANDSATVRSLTITRTVDGVNAPLLPRRECKGDNCPAPRPQPVDPDCLKRKSIIDEAPAAAPAKRSVPYGLLAALAAVGAAVGLGIAWRKQYSK